MGPVGAHNSLPHPSSSPAMPSEDELTALKQNLCSCLACFCFEYSCTGASDICNPPCFSSGKVCCCFGSVGLECPPCQCEGAECYNQEKGICEVSQKMCCMYTEVQFPPGSDIGFGCCGIACWRKSDDKPPAGDAGTVGNAS